MPPPAPEEPAAAAPAAAPPPPTTAAKPKDVSEEAAPAIKGPAKAAKVSQAKAEAERKEANAAAKADGRPNTAMREGATGAESKGGTVDGGRAAGKPKAAASARGAAGAGQVSPTREAGGALFTAPEGPADDLKLISGVGPVLEGRLNALGVTRFDQIAKFKKADIARLDEAMGFHGRIERDDWVKQAKALAKGGAEEYRRVFGKDPR